MKAMYKFLVLSVPLLLAIFVILFILNKPVSVEITLIKVFDDNKYMPISECPVYWTYLGDHNRGSLYFEQNIEEYLNDYDYSNGPLVVSWGRPLHFLSYTRLSKLKSGNAVIGRVTFEGTETPSSIYIYQVQEVHNMRFISEYDDTLRYPEIKIAE